jgi:hypothetical protein
MLAQSIGLALGLLALPQEPAPGAAADVDRPALGQWHELVDHERSARLILLNGGPEAGKSAEDPLELWCWDGKAWSQLESDGPRWRNFASAAYDARRGVIVLHGGVRPDANLADTWEWDGATWSERSSEGPGPREGAALAFDAARGVCVLFGGASGDKALGDTWTWDGTAWQEAATSGPAPRFAGGFVYDAAREKVLLFGGHTFGQRGLRTHGDTWSWDGAAWKELQVAGPSARDGARAVYDPRSRSVLLFGGCEIAQKVRHLGDLWSWDGATWTQRDAAGPPARVHAALAYDARREVFVLTGGSNAPSNVLGDVWEHDGERWRCAFECP